MTPQDYKKDVDDAKKALNDAELELKDAFDWREKCLLRYAEAIIAENGI